MSIARTLSARFLAPLSLAALLLAGPAAAQDAPVQDVPAPEGLAPKALAQSANDKSPWAIASGAEWATDYPRFNPILADAGVTWLRIFDEWGWIQPTPGEWKWDNMDAKLANAKANGIRLSGGLWYFAPWATPGGDTRTAPLKDISAWSQYVAAAAERYKDDIQHWEVLNEFNGSFGKTASGDKARDYADLVVAASKAARQVNPNAKIGLNCANFDLGFFDRVIKAGAAGHFDFICIHPYENTGMALAGEEGAFLTMAASVRKMLAENNQPVDMPIWITEAGVLAPVKADAEADRKQAEGLIKLYVLSLAQGIERVFWFEARGPEYGKGVDHGLIRKDWTPRPALKAMQTMTRLLGPEPKYVGWLNNGDAYGFMFEGAGENVLVTWAPPGDGAELTLSGDVRTISAIGDETAVAAGQPLRLTRDAVFIPQPPADLVEQARANAAKPFPWGGDYADSPAVSIVLAATNIEKGIVQIKPQTTAVIHELAESHRRTDIHNRKLGGEGRYAYFRVDSAFAGFGTKDLEITVVARRAAGQKPASFSLTYESLEGYKNARDHWSIPAGETWQEKTWTVSDANFVGGWGWNFRVDASGTAHDFLIREVRVKRIGDRR